MKYILASASPRRKELLTQAGFQFEIIPSLAEETYTKTVPSEIVTELAAQKAADVFHRYKEENCVVIGADTIVVYRDEILGKPADKQEAYDMLSMLADRTHQVYTGVSLIISKKGKVHTVLSMNLQTLPSARSVKKTCAPTWRAANRWTKQAPMGYRDHLPSM